MTDNNIEQGVEPGNRYPIPTHNRHWPSLRVFLAGILKVNGWTVEHLASQMEGNYSTNLMCLRIYFVYKDPRLRMDCLTAERISDVIGVSAGYMLRLEEHWRKRLKEGEYSP